MGSRLRFRTRLRAGGTGGAPFDPLSVFQDGTDGLYINFATMENLFQESASETSPVTVASQSIGFAFESHGWSGRSFSQQAAVQPELVVNGTFNSDLTGWTQQLGTMSWESGVMRLTQTAGGGRARGDAISSTSGFFYVLTGDISNVTSVPFIGFTHSSGGSGAFALARGAGSKQVVGKATNTNLYPVNSSSGTTGASDFDNISLKYMPGDHGIQATTGARPSWQTTLARFDGSDDNLLMTLNPSAAFTMMVKMKPNATDDIAMGARATTDTRALLGTNPSGQLGGGVGADGSTVITGGSSIVGVTGVAALMYNGTTVKLYWNGAEIYSGAQNGTPATTVPIRIGAFNDNGTAVFPIDGDLFYALAIQKALTPTEIANISTAWA